MLDSLSGATLLYPIVGDPIGFVQSPQRLTAAFAQRNHNGLCIPMLLPAPALADFNHAIAPITNIRGLLITMPHKNAFYRHCATTSPTAKLLQAVSVAKRNPDNTWHGDMLDGLAFVNALQSSGAQLQNARVLQIGAGAAGSAIAAALLNSGIRQLTLHDTDTDRAAALARLLAHQGDIATGQPDPTNFDILINTTPLGLSPADPLPIDPHLLRPNLFVGDVIAGHGSTPLLQAAQTIGCKTANGSAMVDEGIHLMLNFFLS